MPPLLPVDDPWIATLAVNAISLALTLAIVLATRGDPRIAPLIFIAFRGGLAPYFMWMPPPVLIMTLGCSVGVYAYLALHLVPLSRRINVAVPVACIALATVLALMHHLTILATSCYATAFTALYLLFGGYEPSRFALITLFATSLLCDGRELSILVEDWRIHMPLSFLVIPKYTLWIFAAPALSMERVVKGRRSVLLGATIMIVDNIIAAQEPLLNHVIGGVPIACIERLLPLIALATMIRERPPTSLSRKRSRLLSSA